MQYTAKEWLMISIATQFGMDKDLFPVRLQWTKDAHAILEELVDQADEPACYYAAVLALRDTEAGIPSGHMIGHDAIASGPQLLSTATRCVVGMRNTGVLNTGKRPDLYSILTEAMKIVNVSRDDAKDALMPFYYGSNRKPEEVFPHCLALFHEKAKEVAPGAYMARTGLLNSWQPFALDHTVTMPDGVVAHCRVWDVVDTKISVPNLDNRSFTFRHTMNKGSERGVALVANTTQEIDAYFIRQMTARCSYNRKDMESAHARLSVYLGERFRVTNRIKMINIDAIYDLVDLSKFTDNYLSQLLEVVELCLSHKPFRLIGVHDEFKAHPNYTNEKKYHYNRLLWELYHSDLLLDLMTQILGKRPAISFPFDQDVADQILLSEYSIN